MNFPPFLPIRLRKSQSCDRCGQWYPKNETQCPHCEDLDDAQVQQLRKRRAGEHRGNANLGNLFLWLAILGALVMLVIAALAV